jgi:hypothetical protein
VPDLKIARRSSRNRFSLGFKVSMSATSFIQVRLHMKNLGWFSRLLNQQPAPATVRRVAAGSAIALLLLISGAAFGQNATQPAPAPESQMSVPNGYSIHQAVDLGGRFNELRGSGAMYDNMVNLQSGPRVLGESFEMHALPGKKNTLVDDLRAFGSGFGGDPNNVARLDFSKGKYYEFSSMFRRDRRYFDYDLLGNPNIPSGQSIPIGPSNAPTGSFAWPQVTQSPFLFNTVRRMTDASVVLMPLSTVTYRIAYAKNLMEGPSHSPSGYQFAKYDAILQEYQRNNTDDITASIDWKPVQGTKFTFEEVVNHFKGDSYFTLAPNSLTAQEADGTPVAINDFDSLTPYGIGACNTGSMGSAYTPAGGGNPAVYTIFSAPNTPGGLPVINPACAVVTSYLRSQPTRAIFPTEALRLQSTSIKNLSINGNVRFTNANMHLPNYYDGYQGLNTYSASTTTSGGVTTTTQTGATRALAYTGNAQAIRQVLAADLGALWQTTSNFSLADEISFSSMHQPGTATFTSGTTTCDSIGSASTCSVRFTVPPTPPTPTNQTINQTVLTTVSATAGTATFEGSPAIGASAAGYTGQLYVTNNLTGAWDVSSNTMLSLTYRYQNHVVAEGDPHNIPLPVGASIGGTVTINENAGVFTAAVRPTANLDLNGSVEIAYADNALTPVSPRQLRHYRVHAMYKPVPWATISGAFNDLERHNNTNNNQAAVAAGDDPYEGPLDHVDHSRIVSLSTSLMPNEHVGVDFSYSYSDVYTATNICFDNGAQNLSNTSSAFPGTATLTASGAPNICPGVFTRGSTYELADWFGRDFMDAPTQFGSANISLMPTDKVRYGLGYRISSVDGSQFFTDARSVNGSLVSNYETPYANVAYKVRTGLTLKAEYQYYSYSEGGIAGPQYCSFSTDLGTAPTSSNPTEPTTGPSTVVPCKSLSAQTGWNLSPVGETAPRTFRSNNVLLGVHYEF